MRLVVALRGLLVPGGPVPRQPVGVPPPQPGAGLRPVVLADPFPADVAPLKIGELATQTFPALPLTRQLLLPPFFVH